MNDDGKPRRNAGVRFGNRSLEIDQIALAEAARALSDGTLDARSPKAVRARVELLETVLERAVKLPVRVPLFGDRIGLDAILGLLPVIGDIIGGVMSSYLIWEARNLGMSRWQMTRMGANAAFDTALGFVPLVGDAADVIFRANTKNLRIIKAHLDKHHPETATIEGDLA
ncbi:MAG: DUF4112 domain-containing protein [Pseudomonadota bacterium]